MERHLWKTLDFASGGCFLFLRLVTCLPRSVIWSNAKIDWIFRKGLLTQSFVLIVVLYKIILIKHNSLKFDTFNFSFFFYQNILLHLLRSPQTLNTIVLLYPFSLRCSFWQCSHGKPNKTFITSQMAKTCKKISNGQFLLRNKLIILYADRFYLIGLNSYTF